MLREKLGKQRTLLNGLDQTRAAEAQYESLLTYGTGFWRAEDGIAMSTHAMAYVKFGVLRRAL
jgi:hypothetical protein